MLKSFNGLKFSVSKGNDCSITLHGSSMGSLLGSVPDFVKKRSSMIFDFFFIKRFLISFGAFLQLLLLQESWKELFLLHLAQWSIPWDLSSLLNCSKARERIPNDEITNIELVTIQVGVFF